MMMLSASLFAVFLMGSSQSAGEIPLNGFRLPRVEGSQTSSRCIEVEEKYTRLELLFKGEPVYSVGFPSLLRAQCVSTRDGGAVVVCFLSAQSEFEQGDYFTFVNNPKTCFVLYVKSPFIERDPRFTASAFPDPMVIEIEDPWLDADVFKLATERKKSLEPGPADANGTQPRDPEALKKETQAFRTLLAEKFNDQLKLFGVKGEALWPDRFEAWREIPLSVQELSIGRRLKGQSPATRKSEKSRADLVALNRMLVSRRCIPNCSFEYRLDQDKHVSSTVFPDGNRVDKLGELKNVLSIKELAVSSKGEVTFTYIEEGQRPRADFESKFSCTLK